MNTKNDTRHRARGRRPGPTPRRRGRLSPVALTAVVVVAAVAVLGVAYTLAGRDNGGSAAGSYRHEVGAPGPGERAPSIVLPGTNGAPFDLATRRGTTVLLYFQEGIGCQPCWDQIRDIEVNQSRFRTLGIDELVTVTSDPLDLIQRKLTQEGLQGLAVADVDLAVSRTYRTNNYGMMGDSRNGHSFIVVGPDGTIEWRADYGGAPDFTMFVPVDALLADLTVGLASGTGQ